MPSMTMAGLAPPPIVLSYDCPVDPQLFCPCCSCEFPDANDVILHLSSDCQCGCWAVEALLNLDDTDPLQGHDYSEGEDAAQDDQPQGNDYDTFNIPDPFKDEEGNMQTTFFVETDNTNIPNPFEDNEGNMQTVFFIENGNIPTNCSSFVSSPHQVSTINHH
ncbi:hypothetical protein F5J12DRAFT_893771 [Pisolithus orientalis]|uniref:uncharacterized protein n=1 Tax=Pisolithus orientalis TaxID=936130 RepID=UPI0022251B96|nr:uncharacterized protein F5J12DRAFT_893771 [Pisolithus orientalis]KAI6003526.1 hypothetical protein F5J12DRAFT_893771 [Pisolithus orientalis]